MGTIHRLLAAIATAALAFCSPAAADDSVPQEWKRLAGLEPLMTAPAPERQVSACIIDTGVTMTPDLQSAIIGRHAIGGGTVDDVAPARDGQPAGHGTHVATVMAGAVNGWGSSGVWPWARLTSVRVFPEGGGPANVYDYIDGLYACVRVTPALKVINLSIAGLMATEQERRELANRIEDIRRDRDVSVVVGAGNGGGAVESPADTGAALSVGASDATGAFCGFSARGPELDLVAPGCPVALASSQGHSNDYYGTSFAAPQVTSVLLAMRSYRELTAVQAEAFVLEAARPVPAGRLLDGAAALRQAGIEVTRSTEPSAAEAPAEGAADGRGFVDLPPPRAAATYSKSRKRLLVRVANRPPDADVVVEVGKRSYETAGSTLRRRFARRPRIVRVSFINDGGASPVTSVRPRKTR